MRCIWSHNNRRGSMSIMNIVAVMLCTLLIVFILNVSNIATRRIEHQDVADSVAVAPGYWMARGMNAVTATNHVMGELTGIVIVHHALGGDLLDDGGKAEDAASLISNTIDSGKDLKNVNMRLYLAKMGAQALGYQETEVYRLVREESGVNAEAAILDGKVTLKQRLTEVYMGIIAAKIMQMFPPTAPAGRALEQSMRGLEQWIGVEYRVLRAAQSVAKSLTPLKQTVRDQVLPQAKRYTDDVVEYIPKIAEQAAEQIAAKNGALGTTFPNKLKLPVKLDPHAEANAIDNDPKYPQRVIEGKESCNCQCPSVETDVTRDQINKITQLARATFPWVVYHREPVIKALKIAPLSKASHFYKDHSDGYSKRVTNALQTTTTGRRSEKIQLYVLEDHFAPDKGFESFTDNPETADRLFAVTGLAYWEAPAVIGKPLFKQFHADGQVAMAQALIYNANDQVIPEHKIDLTCKRIRPNRQADIGWDTLNWKPGLRPSELVAKWDNGGAPQVIYPEIQVNWQCKLVPVSNSQWNRMLSERNLPEKFAKVLSKSAPHTQGCLNTH